MSGALGIVDPAVCGGKPGIRGLRFPVSRLLGLLGAGERPEAILRSYPGKGTGERTSMREVLARVVCQGVLFLMDAGLYSFDVLWDILQKDGDFLLKVPAQVKFQRTQRLADGSWLAELTGKLLDPAVPPTPQGRKHWKTVTLTVRVIRIEIPPCLLVSLSTCFLVYLFPCLLVSLSTCILVTLSPCHRAEALGVGGTLSNDQLRSTCAWVRRSVSHVLNASSCCCCNVYWSIGWAGSRSSTLIRW
ncbi:MAG: hypothetical protein CVU38_10565 [Chloroflexi bacterium HGW-Chloroflexi-1]|nr:MAG: hypothetical protein CVU38_10565 [Chloroflexi bacterium HGW-Chloroflexi-1]